VSTGQSGMHRAAEKSGLEERDDFAEILKMPSQSQAMLIIQDEESSFLGADVGNCQSLLLDQPSFMQEKLEDSSLGFFADDSVAKEFFGGLRERHCSSKER